MKALPNGYGTLVRIAKPQHPFKHIGRHDKALRRRFYERALSESLPPAELLASLGEAGANMEEILAALAAETASVEAYPEARSFLNTLNGKRFPWLVVSNLAEPYCLPLMRALDIKAHQCRFSCRTGLVKPDPRALSVPCGDLGYDPSDVLMVGDSLEDDVGGAKAAGLKSFHLDRTRHTLWDVPGPP